MKKILGILPIAILVGLSIVLIAMQIAFKNQSSESTIEHYGTQVELQNTEDFGDELPPIIGYDDDEAGLSQEEIVDNSIRSIHDVEKIKVVKSMIKEYVDVRMLFEKLGAVTS